MDSPVGSDPRVAQLEILNEVARIATLDLDLRPMLQRITDALVGKFGWEFVALVTINADRSAFTCEALTTTVDTYVHVGYGRPLGSGVVGIVAATGEPLLLDDVQTFPDYIETMPGARSELCVPVTHHGRLIAIINVESLRSAAFHDDLSMLTTVAGQVAGAIASAQAHAELRALTEELTLKTRALEEANAHLATAIETLHRVSTQDGLTGIANRRLLDETLDQEAKRAARSGRPLSLLMIDIDHFKPFNDEHGHQAGDDVLRSVAQAIHQCERRAADLAARYGGEEFAVLLPETDLEQARRIAEALRERIAETCPVTVSIGVASCVFHRDDVSCAQLVRASDEALYEAKRLGRNRVVAAG
jgi:diguanylate cyclase (GGDEF)-like protein